MNFTGLNAFIIPGDDHGIAIAIFERDWNILDSGVIHTATLCRTDSACDAVASPRYEY